MKPNPKQTAAFRYLQIHQITPNKKTNSSDLFTIKGELQVYKQFLVPNDLHQYS